MPSASYTPGPGLLDDCMIAAMRLVLASAALLITVIDPSEPNRYVAVTYATLALYTLYSVICYVFAWCRHPPLLPSTSTHWVEVGWYVVLIGLSSGTNSIFFFFFFFAILIAAFQWGFALGLRVTLTSAVLFVVGVVAAPTGAAFELNRFLLRPLSLLVLGYMIAYWGGSEIGVKRRLALLKDVSTLSNPRFGIDRTLGLMMEQLHAFYDADACLLVVTDQARGRHSLRCANRRNAGAAGRAEPIPEEFAHVLCALPAEQALLYRGPPRLWEWWRPAVAVQACDVAADGDIEAASQVSRVLAAESFVTVPFRSRAETVGRLYITASHQGAFTTPDVDFLLQVLAHTTPVLNNIQLVDQLASDAATAERQRIAHDFHDSILQPYLGLQMGVDAIRQKLRTAGTDIRDDVERLSRLTDLGIADLRRYMMGLRDGHEQEGGLLRGVQRFARTFTETTGIAVHVEVQDDMDLNDRLAAEVFQMVAEGLSNVRRHTSSPWVTVGLACQDDHLIVRLENDGGLGTTPVPFTPHSLTERAAALGGRVCVAGTATGSTVVRIDIPL